MISIQKLVDRINKIAGNLSQIKYEEAIQGDAEHMSANIKKAEKELEWLPKTTIDEGLGIYRKWM